MKALELTIHPRLEDTNLSAEDISQGRRTEQWMSLQKRLTDAELAAETYKAEAEFRAAAGYGYPAEIITECDRKRFIFEQFATLPHYDEVAA